MLSMAQRDELSREALELARASGDPVALRDALCARYWACLGPDRVAERMRGRRGDGRRSASAAAIRSSSSPATRRCSACTCCAATRRARTARSPSACASPGALRYRFVLFQARFFEGARAACAGDLDERRAHLRATRSRRGRGRVPYAQVIYDAHTLWMRFQRGDHTGLGASAALLEGISRYWKGSETLDARRARADRARRRPPRRRARQRSTRSRRAGLASLERDEHFLLTAAILSDLILELGDRERAAELYDALLPYAHLLAFHDLLRTFAGSVSGELGELALVLGRHDAAVAHYEEALERERARRRARRGDLEPRSASRACCARAAPPGDAQRARCARSREAEAGPRSPRHPLARSLPAA